jgi:hypothetical protein
MIRQIESIKTKTEPLPKINRGLIQVRHIQAKLNGRILDAAPIGDGLFWNPLTYGPYLTPVTRRIE